MKAGQKYVALVTKEREYLVEDSLASLEQEFDSLFLRIHRSTLVARRHVRGFERLAAGHAEGAAEAEGAAPGNAEGWGVLLEGWKDPLPVSRRQWAQVKALVKS